MNGLLNADRVTIEDAVIVVSIEVFVYQRPLNITVLHWVVKFVINDAVTVCVVAADRWIVL
ncbi:MAG TPA: hypothetical protein VIW07_16745 [Candidatus Udaeobacter sp.]